MLPAALSCMTILPNHNISPGFSAIKIIFYLLFLFGNKFFHILFRHGKSVSGLHIIE